MTEYINGESTSPRGKAYYTKYDVSNLKFNSTSKSSNGCTRIDVWVTYPCGCGHYSSPPCTGSTCGGRSYPETELVTTYFCGGGNDNEGNGSDMLPTDGNEGGIGGVGGGGGPTPPSDSDNNSETQMNLEDMTEMVEFFYDRVFIDDDFRNEPCLKSVYDAMGKGMTFQGYLENFEPEFSVAHLRFKYDKNFGNNHPDATTALAITEPPLAGASENNVANYNINITFNGDVNLDASIHDKPKLIIAVAFIHEMIHAEVFRKMLSAAQQGHLNTNLYTTQNRIDYINSLRNNFEGIYDYYVDRWKPNWGHEQMAQHYRDIIVSAISEYDNNQHTQEVYEALAWIGLQDTIAWNNLTQSERDNITQTRTNFINNDTDKCN